MNYNTYHNIFNKPTKRTMANYFFLFTAKEVKNTATGYTDRGDISANEMELANRGKNSPKAFQYIYMELLMKNSLSYKHMNYLFCSIIFISFYNICWREIYNFFVTNQKFL